MKVVTYDENETYSLTGHYGYFIHIITAPYEVVEEDSIKFGMEGVFYFDSKNNKVLIKPRTKGEETNMTFDTNLRSYYFSLKPSHDRKSRIPKDLTYRLKFDYPQDDIAFAKKARSDAKIKAEKEERKKKKTKEHKKDLDKLASCEDINLKKVNFDYTAEGAMELRPFMIFNDDKFTYLKIDGEFTSIKSANEDNKPKVVDYHQGCGYLIIHAVKPKIILRRGDKAVCLTNNDFKLPRSLIKQKI
jgi:P-type conjugative transfer protein VirB9